MLGTLTALSAAAEEPAAGPSRTFKDWVVGCDNLRACTAIGLVADGGFGGYVRVVRPGDAQAQPTISLNVVADSEPKTPRISMSMDGTAPAPPLDRRAARYEDGRATLMLSGDEGRRFIDGARSGQTVALTLFDGGRKIQDAKVSLAGAVAALLFVDAQQKRTATETAMVDRGAGAAASVPAPPAMPVLAVRKLADVAKPGRRPRGVPKARVRGCANDALVFKLSADETLWGVCAFAAAYNWGYNFWRVGDGQPAVVPFAPQIGGGDDANALVNPSLRDDDLAITAFNKGRGIGDCGSAVDWAWTGSAFRPVHAAVMDTCGGVPSEDWPVVLRVDAKEAGAP